MANVADPLLTNRTLTGSMGDIELSPVGASLTGEVTLVGRGTDNPADVVTAQITTPTGTGITLSRTTRCTFPVCCRMALQVSTSG